MKNSTPDKKNSKLNMTNVRNLLKRAGFNPNTPGPLNVVAHSGNTSYFETRAQEYIKEAKLDRLKIREFPPNEEGLYNTHFDLYQHNMIRAIQMLTIAILKVEDGEL